MKLRMVLLMMIVASFAQAYVSPLPKEFVETHRSNFGASGDDYIAGCWHCGDDIFCPLGTKVYSPVDGRIIGGSPSGWDSPPNDARGKRKNFAIMIAFTSPEGEQQLVVLGHLLRPISGEKPITDSQVTDYRVGEYVHQGDFLGMIGYWSRGIHLHIAAVAVHPFPSSGYGIQKLPRPEEKMISGVLAFGHWRDPLPWLASISGDINPESGCYLPVVRANDVIFIQQDGEKQLVMVSDLNLSASASICSLPNGEKTTNISAAENIILVTTQGEDGYSLWLILPGNEPKRLALSTEEFVLAKWLREAPYLPVRISGLWKAFDLNSYAIRSPADVLPGDGSLAWELIGSCRENIASKPYLTRTVVWSDKQASSVLYRDRQASLEFMRVIPLQPDRRLCNEMTKDVVYLRKDMSGCSIWRSILSVAPGFFGDIPSVQIPYFDKNWTKLVYKTTNEIFSCSVARESSQSPEVLFDEKIAGKFVIRKIDLSGKNLSNLTN